MSKLLRITQIRSAIDRPVRQKKTVRALGIRRLHNPVIHTDTPQIRGMIYAVRHLLRVEEVEGSGHESR
jgi:large subunit ribosomal protein L30